MISYRFTRAAAVFALLALGSMSGCSDAGYGVSVGLTETEAAAVNAALTSPEAGKAFLSGTTVLSIDPRYGSQIEHLAADGKSYLWFPGQIRTTPGHWRVTGDSSGSPRMCFLYGANSYDPVEKTYGGAWECASLELYLGHLMQLAKGDPFGLHDGSAPFPMPKPPQALDMIDAQAKGAGKVSQRPLQLIFDRLARFKG